MKPRRRCKSGGHLSADEIRAASLRSRPSRRLVAPEMRRLALHLALDCADCWQAAEQAGPEPRDPVANALLRLAQPGSWPDLMPTTLVAVRTARQRPLGFAYLVIEESWLPAWLRRFVAALARAARGRPEMADVAVLASCRRGELVLHAGARWRAALLLDEARARLPETTGDPLLHARILDLAAKLCMSAHHYEAAEGLFLEAADRLGPEHAARRFHLRQMATLVPAVPDERRLAHFRLALADLDLLRHAADPLDRLVGVHQRAQAMFVLFGLAPDIPWPGYAETLSQLAEAEALYREHADDYVRSEALTCHAHLLKLTDPASALPVYQRALEGWIAAGDPERFKDVFDETVAVQRLAGCEGHVALETVIETFSRMYGPEVVRDRLRRFADVFERLEDEMA